MSNKQKTSIDWLVESVNTDCTNSTYIQPNIIKEAKEMHDKEMRLNDLIEKVKAWGEDKGIRDPHKQLIKMFEESGELASAILKNQTEEEIDAVGDVLVCLIIYCNIRSLSLEECLNSAWNEIKNRTGKIKSGVFVKD